MKTRLLVMNILMILLRHSLVTSTGAKEMQTRVTLLGSRMWLRAFKPLIKDREKLELKYRTLYKH